MQGDTVPKNRMQRTH